MPDILLIAPPFSLGDRYGIKTKDKDIGGHLPPLGLACLAAFIREYNFSVEIIDAPALELTVDDIIKLVEEKNPRVIGITSLTSRFNKAVDIAKKIKMKRNVIIILGGVHATILSEEIMNQYDCFDILVYGEGECTLLELMQELKLNDYRGISVRVLKSISGIVFHSKNKVIKTKPRIPITDLDSLPFPARDLLPMDKYIPLPNNYKRKPIAHMVAIRGCPFNCTFCSNNKVFGRKIRFRSPQKVLEEIKYLKEKFSTKEISFWDDTLTVNRTWIIDLCNLITKENLDITWTCCARVDTVDKELLNLMAKAGCWNIFYGIEAGDQALLDNINKGTTIEQIKNAVKWTKEAGIEIRGSFMLALPGETPELAKKTIEFAKELGIDYAQFSITTPFPGTQLYNNVEKYGKLSKDFSLYNLWGGVPFIPTGYKSEEEILEVSKHAMRSFYLRPRFILSKLKKIRSFEDIKRYFKGLRFVLGFTK